MRIPMLRGFEIQTEDQTGLFRLTVQSRESHMVLSPLRTLAWAAACVLVWVIGVTPGFGQDISSSPSSLRFANTYVGQTSGNQVLTISKVASGNVTITSLSFTCSGYGLASGLVPYTLTSGQTITHYSIFFQPTAAQSYDCDFVLDLKDGTSLSVPLTATGLTTTAASSATPTTLSFPNQTVGTTSAGQTITITNTGSQTMKLTGITLSPPSFTTSAVTLPASIKKNKSLKLTVYYTPSQVTSENGVIAFTYDSLPDNGSSLSGNGVAAKKLAISSSPTLPQATQKSAYLATLATSGGTGPYTWTLEKGSSLPSGLTLSSAGAISGTLSSSVTAKNYTFTVQVTDTSSGATASTEFTLGVYANLGDNCNDITYDVPGTTTPIVALDDLGTGTFLDQKAASILTAATCAPRVRILTESLWPRAFSLSIRAVTPARQENMF